VILYTWCCSCELLKNSEIIITVVRKMRHEKLVNIIRILTMLSFFLDQVEFLKSVAVGGEGDDEKEKEAVTDGQWAKLIETTDPKIVEDLEALFIQYDEDASGELEVDEVKELILESVNAWENYKMRMLSRSSAGVTRPSRSAQGRSNVCF
jgi:hypothetical protein